MKDKELLELAAKAAGVDAYWSVSDSIQHYPIFVTVCGGGMGTMPYENEWNPLKNDCAAFPLAVKLRFEIYFGDDEGEAVFVKVCQENGKPWYVCEYLGDDPLAATRRAIVRAAAAIGETL